MRKLLVLLFVAALSSVALAQVAPLGIIVEPPASDGLTVRVWMDKPVYAVGETIQINQVSRFGKCEQQIPVELEKIRRANSLDGKINIRRLLLWIHTRPEKKNAGYVIFLRNALDSASVDTRYHTFYSCCIK